MARNEHKRATDRARTTLATLAVGASLVLVACGTSQALSGTSDGGRASVIRDPDNPYWHGSGASTQVVDGGASARIVKDPDNPYWRGSRASAGPASDPAADQRGHGPR